MNLIFKFKEAIAIIVPILILIFIRLLSPGHFKTDAKRWAEPSVMRLNVIAKDQIGNLSDEKLIINLGEEGSGINEIIRDTLKIPAEAFLSKNNLNTIRKHDGPVLLFSSETSVSTRIWMLLSQMGYKNIFILTNNADNEVIKYTFRPDTIIWPEL